MITLREDHNSAPEKSAKDPYLPQTPEQIRDERMIASDNRYTHQRRAGSCCSRLVLCCLAVFWLIPPAGADSPTTNDTDAIDICRYNSESLEDLRELVKARALGKTLSELAHALSDDPDQLLAKWEKPKIKIDERKYELTGMPIGNMHIYRVLCPQGFGNQNTWFFDVLEDEEGLIRRANVNLLYDDDQNFAMRNEAINTDRYISRKGVISAVTSMVEARSYNREQIREEMIAGGFLYNRSCITANIMTDNFVEAPFPPNNIFYFMGLQSSASHPAHAAISFSRSSEEFLNAKPFFGEDQSECEYHREKYAQQSRDFMLENYPDTLWTQTIIEKEKQGRPGYEIKNNISFLKSFSFTGIPLNPELLIDACTYHLESFDDLDALVQARGLGKTVPELVRLLSHDPAGTLASWKETNYRLGDKLRELSGVTTGRLYEIGQGCRQESGLIDVWWFRIIKNEDGLVAWIETTLLYEDQTLMMPDDPGKPTTRNPSAETENGSVYDISEDSITGDPIDLCRYGAQSFDDLAALVKARGTGTTLPQLAHILSDHPADTLAYWQLYYRSVDQEIQKVTGITAGRLHRLIKYCPQPFDNHNIWSFHILENEDGRVEIIDPYLFYDRDRNFAMRNEAINAARYATPKGVVQAVTSLAEARSYSREDMRAVMMAGGFWLNSSCRDTQTMGDTFIAPPASPQSLIGLHGYSWPVSMHPHAVVMFSRSSGEFMESKKFYNLVYTSRCHFNSKAMQQKNREFFKKNYPDSWVTKRIIESSSEIGNP